MGTPAGATLADSEGRQTLVSRLIRSTEKGLIPDWLVRTGIRRLLRQRLNDCNGDQMALADFIRATQAQPIALATDKANEQHYEVPAAFFQAVLGPHLKYSCCYWQADTTSLEQAEVNALRLTCEHAQLTDGLQILELGCGWGSLSLWMATHYPNSKITAVSNSHSQRQYIQAQAKARGLDNLQVVTCDINDFTPSGTYDRVVSVEMFEHVRNHQRLLTLIGGWLKPEGKLFVHIFCHKNKPYLFQSYGASNWMGRYFFSGGMMPCFDLLPSVPSPLKLKDSWKWNGGHYSKTSRAWLERQDQAKSHVMEVIKGTYGPDQAVDWHNRWRMFFMACDELFSFDGGNQWYVAHYLFEKKSAG